jgi:hypothetical protein
MTAFERGEIPAGLEDFADTIKAMTSDINYKYGFLTIDEGLVKAGSTQRRSGVHIDGNWLGERHGGHNSIMAHGPVHRLSGIEQQLVIASSTIGCDVFLGKYEQRGRFNGGDCSYVDTSSLKHLRTLPGVAYVGGACSMLHEAAPIDKDLKRTFVRINLV